jgi:hypothetical protein
MRTLLGPMSGLLLVAAAGCTARIPGAALAAEKGGGDRAGSGRGAAGKSLGDCTVFPPDNPWNRDISGEPVDPRSAQYLAAMNADGKSLHPDFGSDPKYGIPWISVSSSQKRVPVELAWEDESDPGPYPFPHDAPIEGGGEPRSDRHVLVIERDTCKLYEGVGCRIERGRWKCDAVALFDLRSNKLRPDGWTSADGAGLPIFPGLVRRDEVLAGEIAHALRFTAQRTQRAYVHPATHFASKDESPHLPPMGLRVRLKASYDLSKVTGAPKVILTALKKYGMLLSDNGSDWFITGESNPAWSDDELSPLKQVPASAFEVVKLGPIRR